MKSLLVRPFAKYVAYQTEQVRRHAIRDQQKIFQYLIDKGKSTIFGKDHHFDSIKNHSDFTSQVPIRDYEQGRQYFDRIKDGEVNICWPGRPKYFAKTSGTTSGTKYIPITTDSMPNHILTARMALMNYASHSHNSRLFDGKVMFLSGSPEMQKSHGIYTGRLSGIVNHEIPSWIKGNQLPSYSTNCISDWEEKVDKIVEETKSADLRLISGIPPWVQMYFERLLSVTGKNVVKEVFPNLQLFIYGGVNYEPYRTALESIIGQKIDSIETFPASEGFIAFQDTLSNEGLLLNTNSGIFFELIPLDQIFSEHPDRLTIQEVQIDKDYALIVNNNAGLWGYNIGDTIRFVSKDPYRIIVSGRVKHFISAFGEHVIAKEVEEALLGACKELHIGVKEYTVAPQVNPTDEAQPYHEWFIEFEEDPLDIMPLASKTDVILRQKNAYYDDLIRGKILHPLIIRKLKKDAFRTLMKSRGKLGGQNKVPRLSNDRKIADELYELRLLLN